MGEDTDTRKINHSFLRDHSYVTEARNPVACGGISCALFYLYNGREQDPPLKPSGYENWVKMTDVALAVRPVLRIWLGLSQVFPDPGGAALHFQAADLLKVPDVAL
ncbi:hypothetical protein ACRRTK_014693 [Alexandromys fortis]